MSLLEERFVANVFFIYFIARGQFNPVYYIFDCFFSFLCKLQTFMVIWIQEVIKYNALNSYVCILWTTDKIRIEWKPMCCKHIILFLLENR